MVTVRSWTRRARQGTQRRTNARRYGAGAGGILSHMKSGSARVGDASDSAPVDESLIDAAMAMSPEERLRQNDRMIRTVLLLKEGWAAMKAEQDGRGR